MSSVQSLSCVHCNPMDCSMPGFPVYHQLLELTQTHVHRVGDAIQPSHPLSSPSPPAFNLSQQQGLYKWYHIFVFLCLVYVHCYVHSSTILNSKTHKQPNPLTGEWIKKMWHIYTMEYYSAIKRMNPGVGKDNLLQYSCLENSVDSGAWWATVHGVAKNWTWLHTHTEKNNEINEIMPFAAKWMSLIMLCEVRMTFNTVIHF